MASHRGGFAGAIGLILVPAGAGCGPQESAGTGAAHHRGQCSAGAHTLSAPGAGMMPKLMASLMMAFAVVIMIGGASGAALASIDWSDRGHAALLVLITAVAVALYRPLGFLITMALLLLVLTCGAERRSLPAAAAFSVGVVALTYLLFAVALKSPLERGLLGF